MHIQDENAAVTDQRLRDVCRQSGIDRMPGLYAYHQFEASDLTSQMNPRALALVRDGSRWSQLVRANDADGEAMAVFAIHFPPAIDNSGFVGWLASLLKARHGTGVIVICGLNDSRGGIFDYWGVPAIVADTLLETLDELFQIAPSWKDTDGVVYQDKMRAEW